MVQRWLRIAFYAFWSVLMTAMTYILGAVPLKSLRAQLGRLAYWSLGIAISAGFLAAQLNAMAVAYFSLVLLIGVFSELEETGVSFAASGLFTLLINSLLACGALAVWIAKTGSKWTQQILTLLETQLKPVAQIYPQMQVDYYATMLALPSLVIMAWVMAIYLAVLFESKAHSLEGAEESAKSMKHQLAELRLPDPAIWLFVAALFGSYAGYSPRWLEVVSVNALNVTLTLLFLQGLSVILRFFAVYRLSLFWQVAFMVPIVVYLFPLVMLLGLVDFWVDFRSRLAKRAEEFKRET